MKRLFLAAVAVAGLSLFGVANAQDFQAAVVFDMGGKFDKSFNQAAYDGAERDQVVALFTTFALFTTTGRRSSRCRRRRRRGPDICGRRRRPGRTTWERAPSRAGRLSMCWCPKGPRTSVSCAG